MKVFLLSLALAASAAAANAPFAGSPGSGWVGRSNWSGPVPSYFFVKPGVQDPAPRITVQRYPPGNPLSPSATVFAKSLGRGTPVTVSGARAWSYTRDYEEGTAPPDEPRSWRARERVVVVPAGGQGFWVLSLKTRDEAFTASVPDFERFLREFKLPP